MKLYPFILVAVLFSLSCGCLNQAQYSRIVGGEVNVTNDIIQTSPSSNEKITLEREGHSFTLTPLANYHASVEIASKKMHGGMLDLDWESIVSPVDFVFIWGELTKPIAKEYISYSQSGRYYRFRYEAGCPFTKSYIVSHSSNNHIIPANENIEQALKLIRVGDKVTFAGQLVNLDGNYKGGRVWWKTSLTRTDQGTGSCEVFYVKKVRIGNKIYE